MRNCSRVISTKFLFGSFDTVNFYRSIRRCIHCLYIGIHFLSSLLHILLYRDKHCLPIFIMVNVLLLGPRQVSPYREHELPRRVMKVKLESIDLVKRCKIHYEDT